MTDLSRPEVPAASSPMCRVLSGILAGPITPVMLRLALPTIIVLVIQTLVGSTHLFRRRVRRFHSDLDHRFVVISHSRSWECKGAGTCNLFRRRHRSGHLLRTRRVYADVVSAITTQHRQTQDRSSVPPPVQRHPGRMTDDYEFKSSTCPGGQNGRSSKN